MQRIKVAVGVLWNNRGQVLVGQRTVRDQYFEKWEFPGGKLEQGESQKAALHRELNEELGVEVVAAQPLIELQHDYPDRQVALFVYSVTDYYGEPRSREGQALKWVQPAELDGLDFLAGNKRIIAAVQAL